MESTEGFVALVDVLGIKRMSDDKAVQVVGILEDISERLIPKMNHVTRERRGPWLSEPRTKMFADTIAICFPLEPSRAISQDCFFYLNDYLGLLFVTLLKNNIRLRGAIGFGTILETKNAFLGKAIYDAQTEYESTSWAGIHYTVSACVPAAGWFKYKTDNGLIDDRMVAGTTHKLLRCHFHIVDVPFKATSCIEGPVVNPKYGKRLVVPWPKDVRTNISFRDYIVKSNETPWTAIHNVLDKDLKSEEMRIGEIAANTLAFFDSYIDTYPDFNVPISIKGPLPSFDE